MAAIDHDLPPQRRNQVFDAEARSRSMVRVRTAVLKTPKMKKYHVAAISLPTWDVVLGSQNSNADS